MMNKKGSDKMISENYFGTQLKMKSFLEDRLQYSKNSREKKRCSVMLKRCKATITEYQKENNRKRKFSFRIVGTKR